MSRLGGALQAFDDRRADARPIQRLLDREDVGIVGRLLNQRDDRIVRLVRVVQQDVALLQDREQIDLLRFAKHLRRLHRRVAQPIHAGDVAERHKHRAGRVDRGSDKRPTVRARAGRAAAPAASAATVDSSSSRITSLRRRRRTSRSTTSRCVLTALVVELELGIPGETDDGRLERSSDLERAARDARGSDPRAGCTSCPWPPVRARDGSGRRVPARSRAAAGSSGSERSRIRARFRLKDASSGNGRASSIASGVRTGRTESRKYGAQARLMAVRGPSTAESESAPRQAPAAAPTAGRRRARRPARGRDRVTAANCSAAPNPARSSAGLTVFVRHDERQPPGP